MIKKSRTLLPILFLLTLSCRNSMEEIAALSDKNFGREERAKDVTIIYSSDGKVEAQLHAAEFVRLERARPPYTDAQGGVQIQIFDSTGGIQTTVTSRYARWYETKGNVLLRDSVRVKNEKGEELLTDELIWSEAEKKFFTEKPVQINTLTQTLSGKGLEADQTFSNYRIVELTGAVRVDKDQVPE